GNTPLHYAALMGHTALVQLLLASAPDVMVRNLVEETPLHLAAMNGQVHAAEILLDHGADIDATGFGVIRPLHLAARMGQDAMVQMLVARGAAVQARASHQETALYLAAAGRPTLEEWKRAITEWGFSSEQAIWALSYWIPGNGYRAVAELLLAQGAALEATTDKGWTPLNMAASKGQRPVVELLV